MKKTISILANVAKKSAETSLKRDANTTTCTAVFQPKIPNALENFKKHDKK